MDKKQILDYYINIGKNNSEKYKIALVVNVRGKTKNYADFTGSSVVNEYFSLTLYEEIQRTLRNAGYEVCYEFFAKRNPYWKKIINSSFLRLT